MDVDFFSDAKIQFIRAKHGPRGVLAVIQLFAKIYRDGFYLDWNEDAVIIFSKYDTGIPKNEINQIIEECLNREIFNKSLFDQYGILTSNGIQKRYFEASRKRKSIKGEFVYLLVNLNKYGLSDTVISGKTPRNDELMREIGKEGKELKEETIEKGYLSETEIKKLFYQFNSNIIGLLSYSTEKVSIDQFKSILDKGYYPEEIKRILNVRYESRAYYDKAVFDVLMDDLQNQRKSLNDFFENSLANCTGLLSMTKQLTTEEKVKLYTSFNRIQLKDSIEIVEDKPNYRSGQRVFMALKRNLESSAEEMKKPSIDKF
jgi:hypothetical protein